MRPLVERLHKRGRGKEEGDANPFKQN